MPRNAYDPFKDEHIHLRTFRRDPALYKSIEELPPSEDEDAAGPGPETTREPEPGRDHPPAAPVARPAASYSASVRVVRVPGPGQRLDWGYAAELLARGHSVPQVAEALHSRPERIWRNLKRSRRFRARVELELDRLKLQTSIQFRNLATHAVKQMERRTEKLDAKTMLWMAEKLRLGARPRKADALGHWLDSVAALQIRDTPPPQPEREAPVQIEPMFPFKEQVEMAEQIGGEKMVQAVIRTEQSRVQANYQLQKVFAAEEEAAEKRVDI